MSLPGDFQRIYSCSYNNTALYNYPLKKYKLNCLCTQFQYNFFNAAIMIHFGFEAQSILYDGIALYN